MERTAVLARFLELVLNLGLKVMASWTCSAIWLKIFVSSNITWIFLCKTSVASPVYVENNTLQEMSLCWDDRGCCKSSCSRSFSAWPKMGAFCCILFYWEVTHEEIWGAYEPTILIILSSRAQKYQSWIRHENLGCWEKQHFQLYLFTLWGIIESIESIANNYCSYQKIIFAWAYFS